MEVVVLEGKNGEWILLWEALTAWVPGALCVLARAIHGAGKRWGQPVANLGVILHSRSLDEENRDSTAHRREATGSSKDG